MKKTPILLLAALLLGGRLHAQGAIKHELALQLLEAMHVPEQLQASLNATLTSQLRTREMSGMQDVLREFYARYLTWDVLKDQYAEIYAAAFSEDELREMTAFYRSPAGQHLARATPHLIAQGQDIGERTVRAHLPELRQMILDHVHPPAPAAPPE